MSGPNKNVLVVSKKFARSGIYVLQERGLKARSARTADRSQLCRANDEDDSMWSQSGLDKSPKSAVAAENKVKNM